MEKKQSEPKVITVSELCRTCLSREDVKCNINDTELVLGQNVKLTDMLNIFKDIKASDEDNLPPKICVKCLTQLKNAFGFGKISLRSQSALTRIINKSEQMCEKANNVIDNPDKDTDIRTRISEENSQGVIAPEKSQQKVISTDIIPGNPVLKQADNLILKRFSFSQQGNTKNVVKLIPANFVQILNKQDVFVLNSNVVTQGVIINNMPHINQIVKTNTGSDNIKVPIELKANNIKLNETQKPPGVYNIKQGDREQKLKIVTKNKANLHITKPTNQFTYKCSKCLCSFKSKQLFMTHLNTVHVDKIHLPVTKTCSVCDISFGSADELKEHNMITHFSNISRANKMKCKIICYICKKECSNHYQLKQHLKTMHMVNYNNTVCKMCRGYFSSSSNLKSHISKCKAGSECLPCSICPDTSFTSVDLYSRHNVENHNLHICMFCTKAFDAEDSLLSHIKITHDDNRKIFQCVYCPLNFLNRWVLMKHLKVKHNVEPGGVICGMCNNGIPYAGNKEILAHIQQDHIQQSNQDLKQKSSIMIENEQIELNKVDVNNKTTINNVALVPECKNKQLANSNIEINNKKSESVLIKCTSVSHRENINNSNGNIVNNLTHGSVSVIKQSNQLQSGSIVFVMKKNGQVSYVEQKKIESDVTYFKRSNLQSENPSENIICRICSKVFNSRHDYRKHMTLSHGIRFKKLSTASSLKSERSIVGKRVEGEAMKRDREGAYLCEICSKRFLRLVNLEKHFSRHMLSSLHCVRCGHNAENALQMEEHLKICRSAQAAEKLICPICAKKLTTPAGLKYHVQAHTGVRKFACPSCGRRFLTCTNMRKHIRIVHSGVRPHLCTLCGRKFPSTDHLAKHVRHTHHNKREYQCKECDKKFLQGCHLAQHMWVHTGIKPYSCPHCPNVYSAVCSLTKHLRRNHWELENQKHIEEEKFYKNLENQEQYSLGDNDDSNLIEEQNTNNSVIGIIQYEKPQTSYLCSPKKVIKYAKDYSLTDSTTRYTSSVKNEKPDKVADSSNERSFLINSSQNEIKEEGERDMGEGGDETENCLVEEVVDNECVNIGSENDIVIDGICADVLGEEINVVIVSGDDIMVNGNEYRGQIMW